MNKSPLESKLIAYGGGSKLLVEEASSVHNRLSIIQKIDLHGFIYIHSIVRRPYSLSTLQFGYRVTYIRSVLVGSYCVS